MFSDGNIPGTLKAFDTLMDERPDLKGKVDLQLLDRVHRWRRRRPSR